MLRMVQLRNKKCSPRLDQSNVVLARNSTSSRSNTISTVYNGRYLCSGPDDIDVLRGNTAFGSKEAQNNLALLDNLKHTLAL